MYQDGNKLIIHSYFHQVSSLTTLHKIDASSTTAYIFNKTMFSIEQWKEAKPLVYRLPLTLFYAPPVCQFTSSKHSYKVNPKNNLKAISMAISVTESWKHT